MTTTKNTATAAELRRAYDEAADRLRHLESIGASRSLSADENERYRLAEREHRSALAALEAAAGASFTDSSLAIALRNVQTMEPGTARSVSLRDPGPELRGTATLVEGTAGVGGNTVPTDLVGPDIFVAYRRHLDLLSYVPEELVTLRASTFDVPTLTAGVTLTSTAEADPHTVSDAAFGRIAVTWSKASVRTKFSFELEADTPFDLESVIVEEHARGAARTVEAATVAALVADGANSVSAAPTTLAAILDGAGAVEADGHAPSVAVLSPADWLTLRKANSADLGSAQRFTERTGLALVLSSSVSTGTAVVLDPNSTKVYRRSLTPVRVIRGAEGFDTDVASVVSSWRWAPKVLAADGIAVITAP